MRANNLMSASEHGMLNYKLYQPITTKHKSGIKNDGNPKEGPNIYKQPNKFWGGESLNNKSTGLDRGVKYQNPDEGGKVETQVAELFNSLRKKDIPPEAIKDLTKRIRSVEDNQDTAKQRTRLQVLYADCVLNLLKENYDENIMLVGRSTYSNEPTYMRSRGEYIPKENTINMQINRFNKIEGFDLDGLGTLMHEILHRITIGRNIDGQNPDGLIEYRDEDVMDADAKETYRMIMEHLGRNLTEYRPLLNYEGAWGPRYYEYEIVTQTCDHVAGAYETDADFISGLEGLMGIIIDRPIGIEGKCGGIIRAIAHLKKVKSVTSKFVKNDFSDSVNARVAHAILTCQNLLTTISSKDIQRRE